MIKKTQIDLNNYLIKQLPEATAFLNKKLEVVYASDSWVNDFEFTERDVTGKKISHLFDTISDSQNKDLKECLNGKPSKTRIEKYIDKNNNEKLYEWIKLPWYNEKENVIGVIIQTKDLTHQISKELELEKLETLLKTKSAITKIGTWEYDAVKDRLDWSSITKTIHEVPIDFEPNLDTAVNYYKNGHSRNTISMLIDLAMRDGKAWDEELQIITEKGNEIWVKATGKPIFNNNKFIGLIGTFQSINDEVLSERKRKVDEQLLKTLINNLPINIYVKDSNLRKILVNKAECEFNGAKSPEELLGKTDFDFLDKKSAQSSANEEYEVMSSLKPILDREDICISKNGKETLLLGSKIPLINENNEVTGIIGMSMDITEKRSAEKEIEKKERYFRSIFNSSYQFTGILNIDGTLIEVNDTALEFSNLKSEEIVGKKFWDAYWWPIPDYVKGGLQEMIKAVVKGELMRSEIILFDHNKNKVPVDFSLKPIYNEDKKVVSLLAEGRNITEMVTARKKIKVSEQKFRTLFEMSPISFILYDFETGKILDYNPSFKDLSGYDTQSIDKITFWDLLDNKNKQYNKQINKRLESDGAFGPFEETLINKDGTEFSVIVNKSLIVNKKREKLVWTIIQDISESKQKEGQIREERKLLKTIIDNLPLNVYLKDIQSRKILVNKAECDYIGVDNAEELLGKTDLEFYSGNTAEEGLEEDLIVMNKGIPIIGKETVLVKKDGSSTSFLISKIPMNGDNGKINGLIGISIDISDIKKKELELTNLINVTSLQNKKLVNFAHIVSHNLRSHAANFSMLLEFLVDEKSDLERQDLTNKLVKVSNNLLETLENLNTVVVIDSSNVNLQKKPIKLNHSINEVLDSLHTMMETNNATIINKIDDKTLINVVPSYLDNILKNFFSNAIKYKSPKREPVIVLNTKKTDGYTILSISDNGLGIDLKKYGDKLFGMYKTFHDNIEARGLGLYISKNQIEAMNGKITTTSVVGTGTTFNIYFNENN